MMTEQPQIDTSEWSAKIARAITSDSLLGRVKWDWFPDGAGASPSYDRVKYLTDSLGEVTGVTKTRSSYSLQKATVHVDLQDCETCLLNEAIKKVTSTLRAQMLKSCVKLFREHPCLHDKAHLMGDAFTCTINRNPYRIYWNADCFEFLTPLPMQVDRNEDPRKHIAAHWAYADVGGKQVLGAHLYLAVRPLSPELGFKVLLDKL